MNREVSAGEADVSPAFWSPMDLCPKCLDHYMQTPLLVEACASVGIERGLHFAKEQLSNGETEILFLAECLLRYIDANDEEPYSHGRWPWSHRYVVVGVSWYDSITGPMSVIQGRCSCGRTSSWTERGQWTMAQLDVRREAGERTV